MRRGSAVAIVGLAMLAIGIPASAARADEPVYGVVSQQRSLSDADMERMAEGQVGMLRLTLDWADVDTGPVAGYDWSRFDEVVAAAARQGISVLPVIYSVPGWVSRFVEDCEGEDCSRTPPHTDTGLAAW